MKRILFFLAIITGSSYGLVAMASDGNIIALTVLVMFGVITLIMLGSLICVGSIIAYTRNIGTLMDKNALENMSLLTSALRREKPQQEILTLPDRIYEDI